AGGFSLWRSEIALPRIGRVLSETAASSLRFDGFERAFVCWLYLWQIASAFAAYSAFERGFAPPPPHPARTTIANTRADACRTRTTVTAVEDAARILVRGDEPLRRRRLAVVLRAPL